VTKVASEWALDAAVTWQESPGSQALPVLLVPGVEYLLEPWQEEVEQIPGARRSAGLDALVAELVLREQLLRAQLAWTPAFREMPRADLQRPVSAV